MFPLFQWGEETHCELRYREFDIDVKFYHQRINDIKDKKWPRIKLELELNTGFLSLEKIQALYYELLFQRITRCKKPLDLSSEFSSCELLGDW